MTKEEISDDFDRDLCGKLRILVNSTDMFWKDSVEKRYYNHLCAMMDRIDESMGYIIAHNNIPRTNDEFILFLMHVSIVVDSIKKFMFMLHLGYDECVQKMPSYLSVVCSQPPFEILQNQNISDDLIFQYIRSISFAHPLDTDRAHLVKQIRESHCSPFVLLDRGICYKDCVGVHVYSNNQNMPFSIQIPFSDLQGYVYSRYSLLSRIYEELENHIKTKEALWKQRKVNREQAPELVLKDIKSILEERYEYAYDIDELISLLTCKYTRPENEKNVEIVQEELLKRIPAICDAIDNMDTEAAYQVYKDVLYSRPEEMHQGAGYELEKIFCYLTDDTRYIDQEYGKMMAKSFTKGFASKWVVMDIDNMSFEEIQMLTRIACFMEKQEQDKQKLQKTVSN